MSRLHVKNWSEFQHYKDRSPPWIKLHKGLLDDFDYARLPLASRALAPCIWLLASESSDGSVPADPEFLAFRLHCTVEDVRNALAPLIAKGFLIPASGVLADCKQGARTEVETEGEVETEVETENALRALVGFSDPAAPADGEKPKRQPVPIAAIVDLYHAKLPELPKVEKLTPARRGYLQQRWREDLPGLDQWGNFFDHVRLSKFLMGKSAGKDGKPPFRADLEWLTKPANFAKIAEDKYHR